MNAFTQAQESLAPYIKSRQEVNHIRRILAAHLISQIGQNPGDPPLSSLSLPNESVSPKHSSGNVRGLQRDYLKALRANVKARREYDDLLKDVSSSMKEDSARQSFQESTSKPNTGGHLDSYVALVRLRQRHKRLRILQNYVEKLSQKAAASSSFLDEALQNGPEMPRVPEDVIATPGASANVSSRGKVKNIVNDLEKAVLQARLRSKDETLALKQLKASLSVAQWNSDTASRNSQALDALAATRNELIGWVEQELEKTGEPTTDGDTRPSVPVSQASMSQQLAQIQSQYSQYLQVRQDFLDSIADRSNLETQLPPPLSLEPEAETEPKATGQSVRIMAPYLEELIRISNEQKLLQHQRSHLTVTLSKQHKESTQLFDRLTDESRLLPAYPLPAKTGQSLSNEIGVPGSAEFASTAHRAKAWTYAAEAASTATMESVLLSIEEGGTAIEGARGVLAELETLLGGPAHEGDGDVSTGDIWAGQASPRKNGQEHDIWATLDGQLGVITGGNSGPF